MRRENEQPLVEIQGGGAVHPTRLKLMPESKRLSALPAVKEPLSKLRERLLDPVVGQTVRSLRLAHRLWPWLMA